MSKRAVNTATIEASFIYMIITVCQTLLGRRESGIYTAVVLITFYRQDGGFTRCDVNAVVFTPT